MALATGRAPFMFKNLLTEVKIDAFISLNGSYVVFQDKVIYKQPLPTEPLKQLEANAVNRKHPMVFLDHNFHYTNKKEHPFIKESILSLKVDYPDYNPNFYEKSDVFQAIIFCEKNEEKVYEEENAQFNYVRWHRYAVDVLPNNGSKAKGIEQLLEKLDIRVEDSYAFGDGLNDIEMLQYVGTGIAMENGHQKVKDIANVVTRSVDNDGILHGLTLVDLL